MSPTSSSASSTPIWSTATARPSASSTSCSASASNLSRNAFMATLIKGRRIATERAPSPEQGEVLTLEPTDDPASVADRLGRAARVEVNFPKFGDGRGYSIARLLRERYGYKGELRAVGQVGRDHLYYLEGCGFDAFLLRDGEDPEEALAAFNDFSESYQASVERPLPLFRRRAEGSEPSISSAPGRGHPTSSPCARPGRSARPLSSSPTPRVP